MAKRDPDRPDHLNDRQRAFVDAYLVDPNASKAARAAGYSAKTARQIGERLLTNVDVAAEVARRQAERAARAKLTADRVLGEIDTLATSDVGDLFDLDADALRLLPMRDWPAHARRAVASVKIKIFPVDKPDIDDDDLADLEKMADNLTNPLLRRVVDLLRDIRFDQYHLVEIKLWDKNSALDKSARHRGLLGEKGVAPEDVRALNAKTIDAITASFPPAVAEQIIAVIRPVWVAAA
jgi:hypothetical protein